MKNINIIIVILFVGLCLTACENFTEVGLPQSQLTGTAVYEDKTTATAALSDIYASMRENGLASGNAFGLSILMANYADELTLYDNTSAVSQFYNHNVLASESTISNIWNTTYSQVYAANALIEGLNNSAAIAEEDKNQLIGEALFIRAYLHFSLTNLLGDIPYIKTTDYRQNTIASKVSVNTVYDNCIADLLESKELLADAYPVAERIRANKAVATALLSRTYLYGGYYANAEIQAQQLINDPTYSMANLDETFLKNSSSTILALHSGIAGNNTLIAQVLVFSDGPPPFAAISPQLLAAFEPGDQRREQWLGSATDGTDTWYYPFKYKQNSNTGTSQEYAVLFRIEEQYLIRAESRAQLGNNSGALEDLNTIRSRAGLTGSTAATQQELLDAISHERQVELFLENGDRWFDLKRTNRAATVIGAIKPAWQNTQLLLPLPETELLLNPNLNPQNPGY